MHSALVRGIVAVPARAKLTQPVVVAGSARIPTDREERPEVHRGHRNKQLVGFSKVVPLTPERVGTPWELEVCVDDVVYRAPLGLTPSEATLAEFWETKRASSVGSSRSFDAHDSRACRSVLERAGAG